MEAKDFDPTTVLAIYGAGLSTLIFIFELIKTFRDKPSLKITSVIAGYIVGRNQKPGDSDPELAITITNNGTKPIVVTRLAGLKSETSFLVNAIELPRTLNPGEYVNVRSKFLNDFRDVKKLFAVDSLNKRYYCDRKILNNAKQSIEGILSKD